MPTWIVVALVAIFGAILKEVSDPIREKLEAFLLDLEKRAKETPNVFDDMLVDLLKRLFAVE